MRKILPPMPPAETPYSDSLWEEYAEIDIADVIVDIEAPDLQPTYSYRVPEAMQNTLPPGTCVHIPFHGRETLGYVLERRKLPFNDPLATKLKSIIAIVEDAITINEEQLHILRWMSERYVCDLASAVRCVAPAIFGGRVETRVRLCDPNLRSRDIGDSMPQAHLIETLRSLEGAAELETFKATANLPGFTSAYAALLRKGLLVETRAVARAKTIGKKMRAYRLGAAAGILNAGRAPSPQQQRLLNTLLDWTRRNDGPMPQDELLHMAEASAASLKGLVDKGLVAMQEIAVQRKPVIAPEVRTVAPPLSESQRKAAETLRACLAAQKFQTILLFGITASGKTEVYLDAITQTLAAGRSAIVLVPEIALTAQVMDVFIGRFGEQVAILHSKLSEGERHDEWRRMQAGKAKIVVGARSAVFAPVENVGLIVMDEEHEASYKQENTPRYNAKDLAAERARRSNAVLLLGSATPSLESYYARDRDILCIEMNQRIGNRPLPRVEVVDLREEFKMRRALFSQRLTDAMDERLRRKQQIILFLNRRGYAQFVLCRECGYVARCPNCAVSMAYHAYENALRCHHCEFTTRAPSKCPDCGGVKVKAFGIGTEKVEEEVLRIFPAARVARMDRDTTARKGAHTRILRDFRQGEADILIGTQMVAKGLDFPEVTLVGVISADTAINMPDFRAAERTFQLLTQVAGRAGRGEHPGEVIIQTFSPDHYAIQTAMRQDYPAFYQQEILFRQELHYPPFSRFANLICADENEQKAQARAVALAAALTRVTPQEIEIIGPSAAPLARLKNQFRFHVALRAPLDAELSTMVRAALARLSSNDRLGLSIDMDPLSMA